MDKKTKIIVIALMALLLLLCIPVIIYGIYSKQRERQWIEDMNAAFPDDHFEYIGPWIEDEYYVSSEFVVSSEKYPGKTFIIKPSNGMGLTNYNSVRYRKDVDKYFYDYFEPWVGDLCDHYEIEFTPWEESEFTPIENITAEEYIDRYVDCSRLDIYMFEPKKKDLSTFEMVDRLIEICRDRKEKCWFDVNWYKEKTENWHRDDYDIRYAVKMKDEDTISHISVSYKDHAASGSIVSDLDLD